MCAEELPWVALPVKKKIGHLKNERQAAEKLFRDGHQAAYEKEAKYPYGLMREAWERALEEVLLGRTLDAAVTKCSRWMTGHDEAAAARAAVPEPTEIKNDIEALENWVAAIRGRRPK